MLNNLIKGEIHSSAAAREAYSKDASIFQVHPLAVAVPKDVADLSKLIHHAITTNKQGGNLTLAPRNGGTCMSGGPLTEGIETWIDGAHNGDAAAALAGHLAAAGPMHVVLGILANKDAREIVGLLAPVALSLTFVPVPGHEYHDPAALAERFGGTAAANVAQALGRLPAPRLIAGSLYLAGAALAANGEMPD